MPARLPAPERRQQLLDTALTTFARRGYQDTSMNDIADAAGVTKPVLYQHFASKRELYIEVLGDVGGQLRAAIRGAAEAAATEGPRRQVEAGFLALFQWVDANRDGFVVLFDGGSRRDPEFREMVAHAQRERVDTIAEFIIAPGLPRDRQRLLAYGIVGLGEMTCRRWIERDIDLDAEELARQVADLAWSGLRGLQA